MYDQESRLLSWYVSVLKKAFDAFDREKKGCISTDMVGTILEMLGHRLDDDMLKQIIAEVDADGTRLYLYYNYFCISEDLYKPEKLQH